MQVDLSHLDDRCPGAAPTSSQRMVCPHGAAAAPGTGGRGTRPGAGPSRLARDPGNKCRRYPPVARDVGAPRNRRARRDSRSGIARSSERAHPGVGSEAALRCGNTGSPATLSHFAELAKMDPSPKVRLSLVSVVQRLPVADRWSIVESLATHKEDATDRMLPLMVWYAVEPLVSADRSRAMSVAAVCQIPTVRRFIARPDRGGRPDCRSGGRDRVTQIGGQRRLLRSLDRHARRAARAQARRPPRGLAGRLCQSGRAA